MGGAKDLYLIAYNGACCAGWAVVWLLAVQTILPSSEPTLTSFKEALSNVYDAVHFWLTVSQSAALLEILHSLFGLVRSPVMVTTLQVMSRIVALVAVVYSPDAKSEYERKRNTSVVVMSFETARRILFS